MPQCACGCLCWFDDRGAWQETEAFQIRPLALPAGNWCRAITPWGACSLHALPYRLLGLCADYVHVALLDSSHRGLQDTRIRGRKSRIIN